MTVPSWPCQRIRSTKAPSILLVLVVVTLSFAGDEESPKFTLLPPLPESTTDSQPAEPLAVKPERPPAFVPTKTESKLPPAFLPGSTSTLRTAGVPGALGVTSGVPATSFDTSVNVDESMVLIGPISPPPLDDGLENNLFAAPPVADSPFPSPELMVPDLDPMPTDDFGNTMEQPQTAMLAPDQYESEEDRQFYQQILEHPQIAPELPAVAEPADAPSVAEPNPQHPFWWEGFSAKPMRDTVTTRPVSINSLISAALQYSAQVQVISDSPLIRNTAIIESDAAFDWSGFMETTWYDTNEPVGSTLTTGGPDRFENKLYEYEYGLRKQTVHGGQLELGQRYGHENSNSIFFHAEQSRHSAPDVELYPAAASWWRTGLQFKPRSAGSGGSWLGTQ